LPGEQFLDHCTYLIPGCAPCYLWHESLHDLSHIRLCGSSGFSNRQLGQCTQFKGWAQTTIQLSFDQPNQTLYGRMNVEGVNLEGVNPLANSFVTVFVRTAIDSRLNPIQFLRPQQLQLMVPVQASNGAVKATVKDVRSEVQDGSLRLHITYDFGGAKGTATGMKTGTAPGP
jgi:hypothetical protein